MSETEYHTGKLTKVQPLEGETTEMVAERICRELGVTERDTYNDTWIEQLNEDGYRSYVIFNSEIYAVETKKVNPYDDIFEAAKNDDGSIAFTVRYYNGGCSFTEAIETALKRLV